MKRRDLNHLDEEIAKVQRSTRTLFGFMIPIHNQLRMRFGWYYKWHTTLWAKPLHWLVLVVYLTSLSSGLITGFNFNKKSVQASSNGNVPRWQYQNPSPTGNNLNDVLALSADELFIVGDLGTILHKKNNEWLTQVSGVSVKLYGVDGYLDNGRPVVWVVGENGTILLYNSTFDSWATQTSGTVQTLHDITVSNQKAWAVGENGTIVYWDGNSWSTQISGTTDTLLAVDSYDATSVFAISNTKQLKFDGSAWNTLVSNGISWKSVVATGPNTLTVSSTNGIAITNGHIWRVSSNGYVTYDDYNQTPNSTQNLTAVTAFDSTHVWVVGALGTILFYDDVVDSSINIEWPNQDNDVGGKITHGNKIAVIDTSHQWMIVDNYSLYFFNGSYQEESTPTPFSPNDGDSLTGISASANNNVWVVGESSKAYQYDGTTWNDRTMVEADSLYAVHAISTNNVWAVGYSGHIYQWDGSQWNTRSSEYSEPLNGIFVLDINHIWAVGNTGRIIYTTDGGSNWSTNNSMTIQNLRDIKAFSESDVWAVGDSGTVIHFNGSVWTLESVNNNANFNAIAGTSSNNFWIVGNYIYLFNGTIWTQVNTGDTNNTIYTDVVYVNETTQYAVGNRFININLAPFVGSNQTTISLANLNSIYPISATKAWSVGAEGTILYTSDSGKTWTKQISNTLQTLNGVYASDENNVWIVGTSNTILYSNNQGTTWTPQVSGVNANWLYIHGSSSTDVYVGGGSTNVKWDGSSWTQMPTNGFNSTGLYAYDANNVWITGTATLARIKKWNGSSWSTETSNTTATLLGISGVNTSDIWVVGYNGTIRHWNGSTWDTVDAGTTEQLNAVYAYDANNVWIVGKNGLIKKWNGSTWSTISLSTAILTSVKGNSNNNIWVAGNSGTILNFTGASGANGQRYIVELPGQLFINGTGVTGTPTPQQATLPFTATIYSVDSNNQITNFNGYRAAFNTSDPNDSHPATITLDSNATCDTNNPNNPCGVGTAEITFHTTSASGWTVSAIDPNQSLTTGTSTQVVTSAGPEAKIMIVPSSSTTTAGTPLLTFIKLTDIYGNETTARSSYTITLSTSSSRGYFATSSNGPFNLTSIEFPQGSSSLDLYYLESNIGSTTISGSSDGLILGSTIVTINPGAVSPILSTGTVSDSTLPVSDPISDHDQPNGSYSGILKDNSGNAAVGKSVIAVSNRSGDVISGGVTDSNGAFSGSFYSKIAGKSNFYIKDTTDNIYIDDKPTVTFVALSPNSLSSSTSSSSIIAGNIFGLSIIWLDRFGNHASLGDGKVNIESSDNNAELAKSETFSVSKILSSITSHVFAAKTLSVNYSNSDGGTKNINLKLTTSGNQTLKVTDINNGYFEQETVLVLPSVFNAAKSDFTIVSPKMAVKSQTTASIKIADEFGNPIPGKVVKLNLTNYPAKLSITPQISAPDFISITNQYGQGKTLPEISVYNITDSSGVAKYSLSSTIELTSDITATNITDNIGVGGTITLEIIPASIIQNIIDNLRNSEIVQSIIDNIIKPLSQIGAGIIGASLILQIASAIPQGFHLTAYGVTLMLQAARLKKKRNPWGRVVDSISGKPVGLAVVRLYDKPTNKMVATVVTDEAGRFEFVAKPGQYFITVSKEKFTFPATFFAKLINNPTVQPYNDRYMGQLFMVTPENPNINLTIPLDPTDPKMSIWIRAKLWLSTTASFTEVMIGYSAIPLLVIGIALSLFGYIIKPDKNGLIIIIIYVILGIVTLVRTYLKVNRQLYVYDSATGKPLNKAVIAIFDTDFSMLRANLITNLRGLSSVLLRKGAYEVKVDFPGYEFDSSPKVKSKFAPVLKSLVVEMKKSIFLHVAIPMKKKTN